LTIVEKSLEKNKRGERMGTLTLSAKEILNYKARLGK